MYYEAIRATETTPVVNIQIPTADCLGINLQVCVCTVLVTLRHLYAPVSQPYV
jgi:hypothetical protein